MCNPKQFLFFQSTLLQEERHLCGNRISRFLFFQSTLLQEERLFRVEDIFSKLCFQSTLLQEERPDEEFQTDLQDAFNPRSYKRSDLKLVIVSTSVHAFNPRSYKRSDLIYHVFSPRAMSFNPRSYKRSDVTTQHLTAASRLSIHAPTRGATSCKSATRFCKSFQSTLLQEERHSSITIISMLIKLSIHAPTRGATYPSVYSYTLPSSFNPRSYKRSDFTQIILTGALSCFQSTLLQEERPNAAPVNTLSFDFQSTLLQEERQNTRASYTQIIFFQSTLLQEERLIDSQSRILTWFLSIHAPTRGATSTLSAPHVHPPLSIHAPTRGATIDSQSRILTWFLSIHAPTRGATQLLLSFGLGHFIFQSTLLQEERHV